MTDLELAKKLEDELWSIAALMRGTARVQRQALTAGLDRKSVGLGPEILEATSKRIEQVLSNLGLARSVKAEDE